MTLAYNSQRLLTQAQDNTGLYTFSYDLLDRPVSSNGPGHPNGLPFTAPDEECCKPPYHVSDLHYSAINQYNAGERHLPLARIDYSAVLSGFEP